MECIILTKEEALLKSRELCEKINKSGFNPTSVVFVANGGFTVGKTIAEYFDIPLFEAFSKRKDGFLKKISAPFLKYIPGVLKKKLRESEELRREEQADSERYAYLESFDENKAGNRIIIADDAVDSGYSMKSVYGLIDERLKNSGTYDATIKTAALNTRTISEKVIKTDYYIYKDYLLGGPWSADSPDHKEFVEEINIYHGR